MVTENTWRGPLGDEGRTIIVEEDDGAPGALYMIARLEDDTIDRIARRVIELLERGAWLSDEIDR